MDNKKKSEKKIYMLALKKAEENKDLITPEELEEFKAKYDAYYKKKKVKRLFANLEYDTRYSGFTVVKADLLDRMEPNERTLKECDEITTQYETAKEFKANFNTFNNVWGIPVIAYKNNGIIKTIPVMYKKHKYLLDKDSLTKTIEDFTIKNPDFIENINTWGNANDNKGVTLALENLIKAKRKYSSRLIEDNELNIHLAKEDLLSKLDQFIYQWCNPKNKKDVRCFSYRRLRDLAGFTLDKMIKFEEQKQLSFFDDKAHTL